jgi:hypothetical protein
MVKPWTNVNLVIHVQTDLNDHTPGFRVKHCGYGHSVAILLHRGGVTTVSTNLQYNQETCAHSYVWGNTAVTFVFKLRNKWGCHCSCGVIELLLINSLPFVSMKRCYTLHVMGVVLTIHALVTVGRNVTGWTVFTYPCLSHCRPKRHWMNCFHPFL